MNRPYVHGIIKEDGDNLRNFAKVKETKVEVEKVDSTSGSVDYLLDEFRLNNGEFVVDDNTIPEGFNYKVSDINFSADDLSEGHLVTFDLNAILNGEGKFKGHMVIDPGNPTNGNFNFDFEEKPQIFCSTLKRSIQTAESLNFLNVYKSEKLLDEINPGLRDGLSKEEIAVKFPLIFRRI